MRQKGLVDLFVMKLDLKNYFLGQFLKQLTLKPSDLVFLCNLDTHVKFRAAMANKAIFGTTEGIEERKVPCRGRCCRRDIEKLGG